MSFYALQVCFDKVFYIFAEEPHKLIWTRRKEKAFAFLGKRLEHLENREIICFHRPVILIVLAGPGQQILRKLIRFLYNNVIDCLFVATAQSINDRKEQVMRHITSQLALIRAPIVH